MSSIRDTAIGLKVGTKINIKDDDGNFIGIVQKVTLLNDRNYSLHLEHCHKVDSEKIIPGIQEFDSETIENISVIDINKETQPRPKQNDKTAVNFIKPSNRYIKNSITKGMTIQIRCNDEDGIFQGIVSDTHFMQHGDAFSIILKNCHKVGNSKILQGPQEFVSEVIGGIGIVGESEYASKRDKPQENYPVVSRSRRQNFTIENENANENAHLSRLYPLQMDELLEQKQIVPTPNLQVLDAPLKPRILPVPLQEFSHMTGKAFKDKEILQYRIIRDSTWPDKHSPPQLRSCPTQLYIIDKETITQSAFSFVPKDLYNQGMIGVSMQGQALSRLGTVSVIVLSTKERLYVFDIVSLGEEWCFSEDSFLREILEDEGIPKVVHDCRALSDILKNKYNILLANVYDTLAAHVVFSTWAIYSGFMPKYAMPLSDLVRGYLGIRPDFIAFQHTRNYAKNKDTEIWMKRPLAPELEMIAVYEAMYLLDLQRATREAMNKPFLKMTEIFLNDVSSADDLDCAMKIGNIHQLPMKCASVLPNWKPNESKACRQGVLEDGFVHQTTCQLDPMLNFSRDVMHQKKPPGEYQAGGVEF